MKIPVVYKIWNQTDDRIYVGSTTNMTKRINTHFADSKHSSSKLYLAIRETGWDHWSFEVLAECDGYTSKELVLKEREFFDLLKPTLNTNRPYRSEGEHSEQIKSDNLISNSVMRNCVYCNVQFRQTNIKPHLNTKGHLIKAFNASKFATILTP